MESASEQRRGLHLSVKTKILLPIAIMSGLLAAGTAWYISRHTTANAVQASLARAESLAHQVRELRGYYTKNVVSRVQGHTIAITQDYASKEAAIPLPATMVHELTETLSAKEGYTIRLYSEHPFPFRKNGGARDAFERAALQALKANPSQPFWRLEQYNGVSTMRYASADLMVAEACVHCHNNHPDTPKNNWKVGDVHGAIELIIPINQELAASQAGSLQVAGAIACGMGIMLLLGGWNVHRLLTPVRDMATAANRIAMGDLDQRITYQSNDETGVLANAFRGLIDYIKGAAAAVEALGQGDVSVSIMARSDQDLLAQNIQRTSGALRGLLRETGELVGAVKAGRLDRRGNPETFQGAYRDLVQGMNETMDAMAAPVASATTALERLAGRDLTARMEGTYQGCFSEIQQALNTAVQNLATSLGQVAMGAEQVTSASGHINQGSQTLAQGATEQANTLEQISSRLKEMAGSSQQNAANAKEAYSLAEHARHSADTGTSSMQRLSQAIDEIKGASDETAKIVKTIDDIAFQTNLLALNAAVEAARAGDAGKGFAVVAEEVRNLAMRSAEAAKNTSQLIAQAVRKAGDGVTLNQEVLQNLDEIVAQIHKVSEVMNEIAVASEQQQQGVQQIDVAVEQLNQVTQQTAANSDEAASASEELSSQATQMLQLVSAFKLEQRGTPPMQRTRRPKSIRPSARPSTPAQQVPQPAPVETQANDVMLASSLSAQHEIQYDYDEEEAIVQCAVNPSRVPQRSGARAIQ